MRVAALLALVTACTGTAAPQSSAQRIGSLDDAIGGPHAIGRVGDFLLENDQIRVVIADTGRAADPAQSTFGRVNTTYGGTLVDADLRRLHGSQGRGNDQLAELLPGFVFTVIDPTQVCVPNRQGACPKAAGEFLRDGSDGGPAEILVKGTGGDLLQMVALLNTGLVFPSNLELSTVYRLRPGQRWVEIETTVRNVSNGAHPFPYLQPQQIKNLGLDIPGLENLQLSTPMGMLPLLGGEQDLFTPGVGGFNVQYAIEDAYKIAGGFPGFPGLAADFVASRGVGVSYGLTVPKSPNNYIQAYRSQYPMQDVTDHALLLPFTYAGVAAVFMAKPPDRLGPGEEFSFTSYFVIGDGDVGSVYDTILEIRGEPTGTFGGRVADELTGAPVAAANVLVFTGDGDPLAPGAKIVSQMETDANGAFLGKLPPGQYRFIIHRDDRVTTAPQPFAVVAGEATGVFAQVAPPATIIVAAVDELGRHAPAKVQLVGKFTAPGGAGNPPDARTFLYSLKLGERKRPTAFDGGQRFIEGAWWTVDGRLEAKVRPGTYDLVVSRGPEYEVVTKQVTLKAGSFVSEAVALKRAFATPGWVAGDFHLHAAPSTDSGLPIDQRVASCAAEGLEVAVATDHNFITDYAPVIASSGLDGWLLGIPGIELTTFEMGHFNAYPLRVDPGSTRGGEFRWANQPPQKLMDQLRDLAVDKATGIVQVNHPRQQVLGYFAQFFIDAATAQPYTPTGLLGVFAPYGDEFRAENFSYDFDAIELLTGNHFEDIHSFRAPNPLPPGPFPDPQPVPGQIVVDGDGRAKFPGTVETWFAMLDRGHRATGMGTSDTHGLIGDEPGYARTMLFVGQGKDELGAFTRDDVITAIRSHRAITTNAPLLEMRVGDKMIGDTVVGSTVEVEIHVRAPSWAKVDKVTLYTTGGAVVGAFDVPADQGTDYTRVVTVRPTADAWVVAEATGSGNMFPVLTPTELPPLDATVVIQALSIGLDLGSLPIASNLKPQRTHISTPYAITNPIWIDVDGNGWTPPKPPLPKKTAARPAALPDIRAQFDALPEVSP
ncbi:MAG: CehA/McbA family metallohydrolase [Deltaproteobacteria bacterium]|nr:CehA/McbA family metallohydrolase [Deltaproteobacteria bacterium]